MENRIAELNQELTMEQLEACSGGDGLDELRDYMGTKVRAAKQQGLTFEDFLATLGISRASDPVRAMAWEFAWYDPDNNI